MDTITQFTPSGYAVRDQAERELDSEECGWFHDPPPTTGRRSAGFQSLNPAGIADVLQTGGFDPHPFVLALSVA